MDRQIRRLGLVLLALFLALFVQLNHIQVLQAAKLANAPGNERHILALLNEPRGSIETADGVVVAQSVPSSGPYKERRVYPHGPLYADVTGYASRLYGSDGVEATYNSYLQGANAPIRHLSDLLTPRFRTDDVVLSISSKLQQVAASALGSRVGAVVALDPRTGSVLAMVSSPTYDPNLLSSPDIATERDAWTTWLADPSQPLLDRAYRQRYPPGSTFKIITSSAIYDRDPGLAATVVPYLSALPLPDTNLLLHNYGGETCGGSLSVLFEVSCDTGFGKLGLELGAAKLAAEANAFGFDKIPPLDLPRPAPSNFPPASSFARNLPGVAYSAIGQENVSATPLQMAMVAGAIANKGIMMVPHVVKEVRSSQGSVVKEIAPRPWLRATSASTAEHVKALMVLVVQGGTATNVALPGVQVAAKTGTAQLNNGYRSGSSNDNWLVAFAPAGDPTIAVAAVVPSQPGLGPNPTGSAIAGPIVKAVLAAALGVR